MTPLIEQHRQSISALCRRYGVRSLAVFGSAVDDRFDAKSSDFDFIVEFENQGPEGAADRYFGLLEDLQHLLRRPVDLVMRSAVRNPYFLKAVERERQELYAA
jgi:hypothetical protein